MATCHCESIRSMFGACAKERHGRLLAALIEAVSCLDAHPHLLHSSGLSLNQQPFRQIQRILPTSNVLAQEPTRSSCSSTLNREGSENQQKSGAVDQRSPRLPQAGAKDKTYGQMAKKKKKSTASGAAPTVPQQGQGSTSGPKADPELVDAGYDIVGAQVPEADGGARGPPSTDRHNTRSTAQGSGSLDGSVTHHNDTSAVSGGRSGLKQSHDGSPPLPHRPKPSDRPDDVDNDVVSGPVEESTKPSIPEGLSDTHQHHHVEHHHHLQQQGADKGDTNGPHEQVTSTTSGWGITSLFTRGGSVAGSGGSDAPPRRDKTKEELANTKRELERSQKEALFYRREMEQSNYDLQRAIGDNRLYSRNIHELQTANARLKDHLLSSQHELANVQRKLDDAKVLADTRERELQATRRQNSTSNARTDTPETVQQNIVAISTILHHCGLLPFTDLLEKINTFNAAISRCASFLTEKVIYKVSEVFDEEMKSRMEDAEEIIGARFCEMLAAQAHNAESSTSKPRGLFLRIIFQMFILNFCVSEISPCSVISVRDAVKSDISSREYHPIQPLLPARTLKAFRSSLIKKLGSIFEVSSWALPGADNRAAFQTLLEPLFEAREGLRVPMQQTFGPAKLEIALVESDTLFIHEYMEDAFASDSRPLDATVVEERTMPLRVVCAWGVGLKTRKDSTGEPAAMHVLNVLPTPVVLESTLNSAMKEVGPVKSLEALQAGDGRP